MKKHTRIILIGIGVGFLACFLFMANGALFKMIGDGFINTIDNTRKKQEERFQLILKKFELSFEDPRELDIFEPNKAGMTQSDKYATHGKYSLALDFPPGPKYPGISFDMYGNKLMDWSNMKVFSFDVYNATPKAKKLIIQIRSGKKYPKKQFKKVIDLKEMDKKKVIITKKEMESEVRLKEISHITIFMVGPRLSYRVYVDNMRVE